MNLRMKLWDPFRIGTGMFKTQFKSEIGEQIEGCFGLDCVEDTIWTEGTIQGDRKRHA